MLGIRIEVKEDRQETESLLQYLNLDKNKRSKFGGM